jgi:hypothetical protein
MGNKQISDGRLGFVSNPKPSCLNWNVGQCLGWILTWSLLAACSKEDMLQKFASPAEQAIARKYIDELRHQDFAGIEKAIDPSIADGLGGGTLAKMAALFPEGTPTSVQLVGANRFSSASAGTTLNLTFEYQFGTQYLLTNVATKTMSGVMTIIGFRAQPEPVSLEEQNKFTLSGKSVLQYGVLAGAIAAAVSPSSC